MSDLEKKNCAECKKDKFLFDFPFSKKRNTHISKCKTCYSKQCNKHKLKYKNPIDSSWNSKWYS